MIPKADNGLFFLAIAAAITLAVVLVPGALLALRLLPAAGRFLGRGVASAPFIRLFSAGFIGAGHVNTGFFF